MPELPEMETYKTLLTQTVVGKPITGVRVSREKSINMDAASFTQQLIGKQILYVERRGKMLLFHLDSGKRLLLHLMLGGWMYYGTDEDRPNRTVQVELEFGKERLYFIGLRLGYLHLLSVRETDEQLADLGPEPLGRTMTRERFSECFAGKHKSLKTALTDQKRLAGIGNCYSDEICFEAGILPTTEVAALNDEQFGRLYDAMRVVLQDAIASGGYMDQPYAEDDQLTGGYNERLRVYDREGEPCSRCGSEILKREISSRKTFYCGRCQYDG